MTEWQSGRIILRCFPETEGEVTDAFAGKAKTAEKVKEDGTGTKVIIQPEMEWTVFSQCAPSIRISAN